MAKLLTAFFLVFILVSCGQKNQVTDSDEQKIDKVCNTFMRYFSKGQFKDAIQLLKQNSVIEPEKLDTL